MLVREKSQSRVGALIDLRGKKEEENYGGNRGQIQDEGSLVGSLLLERMAK